MATRIAILDDYQNVALSFADWDSLDADVMVYSKPFADDTALIKDIASAEIIVAMRERTRFPAQLLGRLPELKLLVTTGPYNDAIDVAAARDLGIVVSATGYLESPAAEMTWGLILAAARNIPGEVQSMRQGGWQTSVGTDLSGKTLGLLGLGKLGKRVAKVGQAFEMRTIAWSSHLSASEAMRHGVMAVSKEELFATSDIVSIHVRGGDRTRGLVSAVELSLMKPTAILVNTSRGPIVDEDALVESLSRKQIGGAAIDVYNTEPLQPDHPLRGLDNVVLTGHIGYVTHEQYEVFYRDAVEDIAAFLSGRPIRVLP
ncbi:D-2-hydroxyacid dehydrogenase family protein [Streptomyces sp. AK02-01A]|uniref:D-2-hydroxyacid dehydrogenase family protein n=1 Tax=Streptomyces sp. AK02-01A TaxID=3028648 RepID=UPI0029A1DECF|nr:D-2-hydroxyacid dehydrogenase family protein [Streptomyces sp. AK02-01A]MDX3855215.1 D-2-hydroxyacid dehydrogenase family protein [Streptomyces sp. AK02-01A]